MLSLYTSALPGSQNLCSALKCFYFNKWKYFEASVEWLTFSPVLNLISPLKGDTFRLLASHSNTKESLHLQPFTHLSPFPFYWMTQMPSSHSPPPSSLPQECPAKLIYILSEAVKFLFIDLIEEAHLQWKSRRVSLMVLGGTWCLGVSEGTQRPWRYGDVHLVYPIYWTVWCWKCRCRNPKSLSNQSL